MSSTTRTSAAVSLALAVVLAGSVTVSTSSGATPAADPAGQALARLDQDADRPLTIIGDTPGRIGFVGVPARAEIDNPGVGPATSAAAAADAALARYGAVVGTERRGTTMDRTDVRATLTGDVARYRQRVDGVPVLGGEVVVSLRADGELSSLLARTTDVARVPAATLGEDEAATLARRAFTRSAGRGGPVAVASGGRWLVDAGVLGGDAALPARAAWRFEVTRGVDERRMLLVDDRTGAVLMNVDLVQHALDRVVCDNADVRQGTDVPCTSGFARTEGGAASATADVNTAYDLSGVVADFYQQVGTIDLTQLLGVSVGGTTRLASTVRWCTTRSGTACPFDNAFWNGSQMYYGQGYAGADDVVGHEITHGFTERTSGLFYWGQSGAINESISDIVGEIIDHRNPSPGDSPTSWALGEDVPGLSTGLRNLQDPTIFSDPDSTQSSFYRLPESGSYPDSDGVHTNSGVGNKTFHLISQGGSLNGQTVTGIDTGDATLTKSARLWLLLDQSLTSGSDFADLGAVLAQSCQALLATPGSGFTSTDCASVQAATAATQLALTPLRNPQPADAPATCPAGTARRVLLDSETGPPTATFTAGPTWRRDGVPGWGQVAHSKPAAWGSSNPTTAGASSLVATTGVTVPTGQPTYLWFQQWRLLDYTGTSYWDGGAVEIDRPGGRDGTASLPWVNGPTQTIATGQGNPIAGQVAFGGDSRGYVASRVDLSSYGGQSVKPVFTVYSDMAVGSVGWFVDDVQLYTCEPPAVPPASTPTSPPPTSPATTAPTPTPTPTVAAIVAGQPTVAGKAQVGRKLTAKPGSWSPASVTLSYQWLRNGKPIAKATRATYTLVKADQGKKVSVRVTGTAAGSTAAAATSKETGKVKAKPKKHKKR